MHYGDDRTCYTALHPIYVDWVGGRWCDRGGYRDDPVEIRVVRGVSTAVSLPVEDTQCSPHSIHRRRTHSLVLTRAVGAPQLISKWCSGGGRCCCDADDKPMGQCPRPRGGNSCMLTLAHYKRRASSDCLPTDCIQSGLSLSHELINVGLSLAGVDT